MKKNDRKLSFDTIVAFYVSTVLGLVAIDELPRPSRDVGTSLISRGKWQNTYLGRSTYRRTIFSLLQCDCNV